MAGTASQGSRGRRRADAPPRGAGAHTPEELETLCEDAGVIRDAAALVALFEDGGVLVVADDPPARGRDAIARATLALWDDDRLYLTAPLRVVQARDLALVVAERAINVVRRGSDGAWRYAIVLQLSAAMTASGVGKGERCMGDGTLTQPRQPLVVPAREGQARWWFSNLAVIKTTAADTGGQMTIIEVTEPPGVSGPRHVHHREDEAFWVLEGDVTFEIGATTIAAHAGDYVFGPRDIPHRYTVGDAGCRMLFILTPGGFEDLVIAMSVPAASRTLPPPSAQEPDWEWIAAVAAAHGCELLR